MEINIIHKNVKVGKINLEVKTMSKFKQYVCNGCFREYINFPNRCKTCGYSQCQEESIGFIKYVVLFFKNLFS